MPRRILSKTKSKILKAERRDKRKRSFPVWLCRGASYLRRSQRYAKSVQTERPAAAILRQKGCGGRSGEEARPGKGPKRKDECLARGRSRGKSRTGRSAEAARSGAKKVRKGANPVRNHMSPHFVQYICSFRPERHTGPVLRYFPGWRAALCFILALKNDGYLKIFVIFEHLERHEFLKYERKCRFI